MHVVYRKGRQRAAGAAATALRFDVLIGTYRSGARAGVASSTQKTERKTAVASCLCIFLH